MMIRSLGANDAEAYRALMLEAYGAYPQAFTSSVAERALMPLSWWEKRVDSPLDRLLGAFEGTHWWALSAWRSSRVRKLGTR